MATYDKCRHCKYSRLYLYDCKCYECINGSNFEERILDEKLWESEAIQVKNRAEIKYKELLNEYIKLGKIGLGANAYMNLMCVGEILGYPKSKINEDLSKELEKNGTSIKDNS